MKEKALDKKFGLMLSAVFAIFAIYLLKLGSNLSSILVSMLVSIGFTYLALFAPRVLSPFTKTWLQFGELLNKITSPFILGIVFFGIITPLAFFFKLLRKDLLKLKWNSKCPTYWIKRDTPGPLPQEMENPF